MRIELLHILVFMRELLEPISPLWISVENCHYYVFTETMKIILGAIFLYHICVNNLDFSHKFCILTLRKYALFSSTRLSNSQSFLFSG